MAPAALCRSSTFSPGRGTTGFNRFLLGQDALDPTEVAFFFLRRRGEGGQGLVHLASRGAAFRLRFIQRLLTGHGNTLWRPLSRCMLQHFKSLGLDFSLFLLNDTKIISPSLPVFYKSVFKVWNLLKKERRQQGGLPALAAAGAGPIWDHFR